MFWRVGIEEEDQRFLRYVWHFKGDDEPTMIQSKVLTFCLVSAPFQAVFTVLMHCDKHEKQFPKAVEALRTRLYVDEGSGLANEGTEAVDITREMWQLLVMASLIPHKLHSNNTSILEEAGIPSKQWANKDSITYLGLNWNTVTDPIHRL